MKRMKVTPPSADLSEHPSHPAKMRPSGHAHDPMGGDAQTSASDAATDLRRHVLRLLATELSPASLQARKDRLEILRKCSYYMEVHQDLTPPPQPPPMSHSTLLHLIDPWKFQRMKRLAGSQVRVLLSLLEELYEEIGRGVARLQALPPPRGSAPSAQDPAPSAQDHASLRRQVEQLSHALLDFDTSLPLGRLHAKHALISNAGHARVPRLLLRLGVKMPVLFDRARSAALPGCTRLHWFISGTEPQEAGETFEIHHRPARPGGADDEAGQTGVVTCGGYCVQINNLLPARRYEFTVKRADTCHLVYGLWNETLVLQTPPACAGGGQEKRRRLYLW